MNLDAPTRLPVKHLSHTSIESYLMCPEAWRRRYIENERSPAAGNQILGRAVHTAVSQSYAAMVDNGEPNSLEQVLDDFTTTLKEEDANQEVEYDEDESLGGLLDRGAEMLVVYNQTIVPHMLPERVENRFTIKLQPEYEWDIIGNIDVVGGWNDGFQNLPSGPHDIKTVKKSKSEADYQSSIQATLYTYVSRGWIRIEGRTTILLLEPERLARRAG